MFPLRKLFVSKLLKCRVLILALTMQPLNNKSNFVSLRVEYILQRLDILTIISRTQEGYRIHLQ